MSAPRTYCSVMAEAMTANARYHELMAEAFPLTESFSDAYTAQGVAHHTRRCAEQRERAEYYAARAAAESQP